MSENARYWIWLQNALGYGAKIKSIIDEYKSAKLLYELGESEWKMSTVLSKRQVEKLIMTDVEKSDEIIDCCSKNGYKIIDFDDFVFFTTESKSIILMPGFSTNKLHPRSSQTTNIDDLILGLLFPGCPGKLAERFGEEVRRDRSNSSQSFKKQLHRKPKPSGDSPNPSSNK